MRNLILERLKELEKRRDKYKDDYQISGSTSSLKTYEKYDDLCEICGIALRSLSEENEVKMHILRNMNNFIKSFKDVMSVNRSKTYTGEEVLELLERMKRMV